MFSRAFTKILGAQLLTDVSGFVAALDSMFGGFRQRAEQTYKVLQARETAFLVVAAPEPDAIREAAYFAGRLATEQMPLAGLVLNRVHDGGRAGLRRPSAGRGAGAESRASTLDTPTCCGCTRNWWPGWRASGGAAALHRRASEVPVAGGRAQPADVHDIDGLRVSARPSHGPSAIRPRPAFGGSLIVLEIDHIPCAALTAASNITSPTRHLRVAA